MPGLLLQRSVNVRENGSLMSREKEVVVGRKKRELMNARCCDAWILRRMSHYNVANFCLFLSLMYN